MKKLNLSRILRNIRKLWYILIRFQISQVSLFLLMKMDITLELKIRLMREYVYENFKTRLQGLSLFCKFQNKGVYVKETLNMGRKYYEDSTQFFSVIGTDSNCIVTR